MLDYTTTEKIRRLNDCFRRSMAFGGSVILTTGVACLDSQRKVELLDLVRRFDKFTPANDPHGEHDFGAIDWSEFWNVVNGHGPCNRERLAERVKAWDDGAWVREAALAHERKRATKAEAA